MGKEWVEYWFKIQVGDDVDLGAVMVVVRCLSFCHISYGTTLFISSCFSSFAVGNKEIVLLFVLKKFLYDLRVD